MRLANVAKLFDNTECTDAYTPFAAFMGQLDLFDDSKRDGATVERRVLSVGPAVVVPARRCCTISGEQWIVGTHQSDNFRGAVIRNKYVIHRADGLASIQTAAQAIAAAGGVTAYAAKLWVKDLKELEVSSKLDGFFNIYLPSTETVAEGAIITLNSRLHIVRNTFLSAAGFLVAEADELAAGARQAATYYSRTYTPATDSVAAAGGVAINVIRLRFQDNYAYRSANAPKLLDGDIRALVSKASATTVIGDRLTLPDASWQVVSVLDQVDSWGVHLRMAGT